MLRHADDLPEHPRRVRLGRSGRPARQEAGHLHRDRRAFPNAAAASKRAGCSRQTIGNCAAGRSRTAGGYHWAYAEQPPGSWRAAIECPEASAKFESLGDAAEWAGCEAAEIADCLAGKKDEAGGVRWRFRKLRGGRRTMPIVCVETGDEFPSIRAAEE